ncbi:Hsp70 family protein [Dactylosporangium salmoneum]|uniref:Hsp70 family protein n=1 Tax=Dactylosporangium salmoneum TaxID=53361 RepID=A0ABP5SJ14_9ACTN
MTTYGIDLGTTNSCIAYIDRSGAVKVVRNALSEETTPSVVYFEDRDNIVVGRAARNIARLKPEDVVDLVKRRMGEPGISFFFHGEQHTPESVSALILRELAQSAAAETKEQVRDVVITVPAYFGVAEREATRKAGHIAGLNVLNVIPEPVAAALHYQVLDERDEQTIFVYDLGGGTFDTTVIRLTKDEINVVCTDGDHKLGGTNWDEIVVEYLNDEFRGQHSDLDPTGDEQLQQELYLVAEQLKKDLSTMRSRSYAMRYDGAGAEIVLDRESFERRTAHLLESTFAITQRTLEVAAARGVDVHRFDAVLLVGGATRMPAVAQGLRDRFGFEPMSHDPDLAVAKGAALFSIIEMVRIHLPDGGAPSKEALDSAAQAAAEQMGTTPEAVMAIATKRVTTVVPRAFGIRVRDHGSAVRYRIDHLLIANQELPASSGPQEYMTVEHGQTAIAIEVFEQSGAIASDEVQHNTPIGEGMITGLPRLPKGSPVRVTFDMDETGRLSVHAVELSTRRDVNFDLVIGLEDAAVEEARAAVARKTVSQ